MPKPRNKLLADIFYKAGFIESWGRGTINIINECKNAYILRMIKTLTFYFFIYPVKSRKEGIIVKLKF